MATTPEDKKTAAQLKKEEAERKAQSKLEEQNRQELLDTISDGFKSIEKISSSIFKSLDKQTENIKRTSDATKKMSSSLDKLLESSGKEFKLTTAQSKQMISHLGSMVKLQRELTEDNTVELLGKQFGSFSKYFESSGKKLERTADYSELTAKRLWTLLSIEREDNTNDNISINQKQFDVFVDYFGKSLTKLERIADHSDMMSARTWNVLKEVRSGNADNSTKLVDSQWEVIKKIRERLVRIQQYTDFTSSRVWVLQDLMKENTKAISSVGKSMDVGFKSIGADLGDIFDLLFESSNEADRKRGRGGDTTVELKDSQYSGLLSAISSSSISNYFDRLYRLLGGGSGNAAGHLYHLRKTIHTLIKSVRDIDGGGSYGGGGSGGNNVPGNGNQPNAKQTPFMRWLDDMRTTWNRFTTNFMGIFQRGIVGRIAGLNPLIGMATDVLRDIGQTISDIGGTIYQAYMLFSILTTRRAASSGVAPSVLPQEKGMMETLSGAFSSIATFVTAWKATGFSANFGSFLNALSDIGKVFVKLKDIVKLAAKRFVIIDSIFNFFSNIFQDFRELDKVNWVTGLSTVIGRAIISVGEAVANVVLDLPTWIAGGLLKWLGADTIGQALMDFDFSGWVSKWAGDLMTTFINTFSQGWRSGLEFFTFALEAAIKSIGIGYLRMVGANDMADSLQSSIGNWTEKANLVPANKQPLIAADTTKTAQQKLDETKQVQQNTAIVAPSTTVIQQQAPQAVPYAMIPSYNTRFANYS